MYLGVTFESLWQLDLRRDARGNAAFPMRDGEGAVTSIRLRNPATGRKWSVKGSRDGLFYARGFKNEKHEELVVLEGPSDTAAYAPPSSGTRPPPSGRAPTRKANDEPQPTNQQ